MLKSFVCRQLRKLGLSTPNWCGGRRNFPVHERRLRPLPRRCKRYWFATKSTGLSGVMALSWRNWKLPSPTAVAVSNAGLGQAFVLSQGYFAGHPAHRRRDFCSNEFREVVVGVVPAQQQHSTLAHGLRQDGAPDLKLLHPSGSFQTSTDSTASGCSRYASRIRSVSRRKRASLTARRMKSARWRLAAGAIRSMACNVASSKWTRTWGIVTIYLLYLYIPSFDAAKAWGQNDDITFVTARRNP